MPHQMIKFRLDHFVYDLRRAAHLKGQKWGYLDWTFAQWEWVSAILLVIGGILLTVGSCFFLPEAGPTLNHAGSWVFVGSSCCYMITSTHDFLEVVAVSTGLSKTLQVLRMLEDDSSDDVEEDPPDLQRADSYSTLTTAVSSLQANNNNHHHHQPIKGGINNKPKTSNSNHSNNKPPQQDSINWMEWFTATVFLCGACLFFTGTTASLVVMPMSMDPFLPTALAFIVGSCCCLSGSLVNALQIWDAPDRAAAQYANAVAINYIMGSSFYLCGSLPYLYYIEYDMDRITVMRLIAMFFIIGSVLFLVAAFINVARVVYMQQYDPEANAQFKTTAAANITSGRTVATQSTAGTQASFRTTQSANFGFPTLTPKSVKTGGSRKPKRKTSDRDVDVDQIHQTMLLQEQQQYQHQHERASMMELLEQQQQQQQNLEQRQRPKQQQTLESIQEPDPFSSEHLLHAMATMRESTTSRAEDEGDDTVPFLMSSRRASAPDASGAIARIRRASIEKATMSKSSQDSEDFMSMRRRRFEEPSSGFWT